MAPSAEMFQCGEMRMGDDGFISASLTSNIARSWSMRPFRLLCSLVLKVTSELPFQYWFSSRISADRCPGFVHYLSLTISAHEASL
jgi:hypothetical protein